MARSGTDALLTRLWTSCSCEAPALPNHCCHPLASLCRYDNPESKETGRVWVMYENGHEAPLEPKLGAGYMSQLG